MKPIPDDVEPVPQSSIVEAKRLADGGAIALLADAAAPHTLPHGEAPLACYDVRHRIVRVKQIAPDRWVIARGVLDALRNERKVQFSPQIDQLGNIIGLTLDNVDGSCAQVLGFQAGDFLRSVNAFVADLNFWGNIYQSVMKDGAAVIRFERGGHPMTWLYEVRNE